MRSLMCLRKKTHQKKMYLIPETIFENLSNSREFNDRYKINLTFQKYNPYSFLCQTPPPAAKVKKKTYKHVERGMRMPAATVPAINLVRHI